MKNKGWNSVDVTILFEGHFPGALLLRSNQLYAEICKESPRELNSVSGDWPVGVKAASNLFYPTKKRYPGKEILERRKGAVK